MEEQYSRSTTCQDQESIDTFAGEALRLVSRARAVWQHSCIILYLLSLLVRCSLPLPLRLATGHALSVRHHRYPPLTSAMPSSALLSTSGRLAAAPCAVLLAGLRFASAPDRCSRCMASRSNTASYAADHNMWNSELAPCFARSQRAPTRVSLLSSARHLVPLEHSTAPCARLLTRHFRRRLPLRANAAMLCDVQHADRLLSCLPPPSPAYVPAFSLLHRLPPTSRPLAHSLSTGSSILNAAQVSV